MELNDKQFGAMARGEPTSDPEEKKARIAAAQSPDYHARRQGLKSKAKASKLANTGA